MAFEVWLMFVVTEGALCLTPGPAVLLVISQGLTRGSGASGLASLGILAANLIYFGVSATGLAAVLLASYEVFALIRWVGAAYLIWLGVTAFRGRSPALSVAAGPAMPAQTGVGARGSRSRPRRRPARTTWRSTHWSSSRPRRR